MTGKPLVSVVTATRNRTDLLARALKSIARQSHQEFEAIIVDDGSDLETRQFHSQLATELGERFQWVKPAAPGCPGTGPAAARNRGIQRARGEFIAFLDDDDEWVQDNHLQVAIDALRTTDYDYFFGNMVGYRDELIVLSNWFPNGQPLTSGERISVNPPVYKVTMQAFVRTMRHDLIHPDTSVIRRTAIERAGLFIARLSYSEDYNLMMRVADVSRGIVFRPCIVARYRLPTGNSVSLTYSRLEECLQRVFSAQHVRLTCTSGSIRQCARAREAWSLREMAAEMDNRGMGWEAARFRLQAVTLFPTAHGLIDLARSAIRTAVPR